MRPTLRFAESVNQMLPSGPRVSPAGFGLVPGRGYSVMSHKLALLMQAFDWQA
jgi:hypothetical protein